ncbi:MAG: metal ABC transporter substrate-binding protein [Faecousia sp.]
MKKQILALLFAAALAVNLAGCAPEVPEKNLTIVTAIFPEYDWVRQLIGPDSHITLRLLVDDGVDPHSFQPTVEDMVTVSGCDLLIFGGGESDEWLADALKSSANPNMRVLELMDLLGDAAHTAEVVEGMQVREAEDETDEHIWLSLRNAALFCSAITEELCLLDPEHADTFRANLGTYLEKLRALDEAYQQTVQSSAKDTILVCDRFPFRYLTEDYGLHYYAAFPGCSAESGASFETVVFLADRVKELELNAVLVTEGSDGRLARTVVQNAGRENVAVLTLDSMQSVSLEAAAGREYLAIMEQNRQVLASALE